ncbi:PAS domain S-box protein [Bradyrhizobium sp. LHD-71]|uniref:PAS domain S-box protein n=1 Tax=Bradyrhizobium sp. LHD-71 TaxID=3072141 RepID=UPI00280C5D99|nr:PAS domain S-box protein [Bradyrhizobium sp. LHD-71]MDQ8729370.1 PAS domain S-box protein [Bradyrhizobium sp. LHD-71]
MTPLTEAAGEPPFSKLLDDPILVTASDALNVLPVAGYVCAGDGAIIHYNRHAAELWGRAPTPRDPTQRFCGSLRLYRSDGILLPHSEYPVAETLRSGNSVRGRELLIERPDGSRILASLDIDALRDSAGEIVGAITCMRTMGVASNVQARADHDTNAALDRERQSEARSRPAARAKPILFTSVGAPATSHAGEPSAADLLEALPAAIYMTDADGRITMFNKAAVELSGRVPEIGVDTWCVTWKLYWPDGTPLPHDQCPMALALKERRPIRGIEAVAERPDGTRVPFMPFPSPIFDASGRLVGAINMLVDLTEIKHDQEAAARLAAIVESSNDAIVSKNLKGIISSWNRGAERLFGYSAEEVIGRPINILIPEDRSDEEPAIIERISRGERVEIYETIRRRKDGSLVHVSLSVSPVRDATGRVTGASKIARDMTEYRLAEQQKELLLREMNHRVKNMFTLTSGMVSLSKRSARTPEDLAIAVQGRLQALASAHDLTLPDLSGQSPASHRATTLGVLLRAIVAPHLDGAEDADRVTAAGPDVQLGGRAARSLALVLHELATNAAKYGALSSSAGRIRVDWSVQPEGLRLTWTEQGGPPLAGAPASEGFGSLLARQTVKDQFGGSITHVWNPGGLTVDVIMLPDRLTE